MKTVHRRKTTTKGSQEFDLAFFVAAFCPSHRSTIEKKKENKKKKREKSGEKKQRVETRRVKLDLFAGPVRLCIALVPKSVGAPVYRFSGDNSDLNGRKISERGEEHR